MARQGCGMADTDSGKWTSAYASLLALVTRRVYRSGVLFSIREHGGRRVAVPRRRRKLSMLWRSVCGTNRQSDPSAKSHIRCMLGNLIRSTPAGISEAIDTVFPQQLGSSNMDLLGSARGCTRGRLDVFDSAFEGRCRCSRSRPK